MCSSIRNVINANCLNINDPFLFYIYIYIYIDTHTHTHTYIIWIILVCVSGIPQGSVLAALLSNLHHGNIEAIELSEFLQSPEVLLMRWVDDYIFATVCEATAYQFLDRIFSALQQHGVCINTKKVLINFGYSFNGRPFEAMKAELLPWCGYIINTKTLEVQYNFLQYVGKFIFIQTFLTLLQLILRGRWGGGYFFALLRKILLTKTRKTTGFKSLPVNCWEIRLDFLGKTCKKGLKQKERTSPSYFT